MKKLKIIYSSDASVNSGEINCVVSESIGDSILIMATGTRNLLRNHYSRSLSAFKGTCRYNPYVSKAIKHGRLWIRESPKYGISNPITP